MTYSITEFQWKEYPALVKKFQCAVFGSGGSLDWLIDSLPEGLANCTIKRQDSVRSESEIWKTKALVKIEQMTDFAYRAMHSKCRSDGHQVIVYQDCEVLPDSILSASQMNIVCSFEAYVWLLEMDKLNLCFSQESKRTDLKFAQEFFVTDILIIDTTHPYLETSLHSLKKMDSSELNGSQKKHKQSVLPPFWQSRPKSEIQVDVWVASTQQGYAVKFENAVGLSVDKLDTFQEVREGGAGTHPLVVEDTNVLHAAVAGLGKIEQATGQESVDVVLHTSNQIFKYQNDFWVKDWAKSQFLINSSGDKRPNYEQLTELWRLKQKFTISVKQEPSDHLTLLNLQKLC